MRWRIEKDEIVDNFEIFQTRKSTRINPRTGGRFTFFLMSGRNWVNLIPLTAEQEVILVKQYRHGAEEVTLEIPGGCIDPGEEDPAASALRELEEETGYSSDQIIRLGSVQANPAMQSMLAFTYLAKNCRPTKVQTLDPNEEIEVILKPLDQVFTMIKAGEIKHALVVAAFGHLLLNQSLLKSDQLKN